MIDWHYSISGLFVGALVGITGVGGGSLMTPILVLFFGINPVTAVGTDLLYAAITKSVGTAIHGHNRSVNWKIVLLLACGSVPGALATLYFIARDGRLESGAASIITTALGSTLLLTAILLLFRNRLLAMTSVSNYFGRARLPEEYPWPTIALGLVLGILVTLTSVGAGALGVSLMLFLYPRLRLNDIVGSDIAHAVPLTLISGIGYWMIGGVNWHLLLSLLCGSIPGIILGSLLAFKISDALIRPALAVLLAVVGLKLIMT